MTANDLKKLAESLPALHTENDESCYGVYYKNDSGAEETLLSGTTDPVTRLAVEFIVAAQKFFLEHEEPDYPPMSGDEF